MVSVPEVKMMLSGSGRWRGNRFRINFDSGYKFYYLVPDGFADGTESEVVLNYQFGFKYI